jgi:ABC-type nickel/cobalt efflux system permease component RcnA
MAEGVVGLFILGGVVWVVCAIMCYYGAAQRGRTPLTWGILGIVGGPIALVALYLMPRGHHHAAGHDHDHAGHDHDHVGHDHPAEAAHHEPHGTQTQTQADLYEVPKDKHKH